MKKSNYTMKADYEGKFYNEYIKNNKEGIMETWSLLFLYIIKIFKKGVCLFMSMTEWARNEIKIACERERKDSKEGEWDYGVACYESALKAFECLMGDGHSGMSIGITKNILIRLIEGKPLTPIEDTPDIWELVENEDDVKCYQCSRMSSLFKYIYPDGTVKYSDVNRVYGVDINNPNCCWHSGSINKIVNERYPITMPYNPSKAFEVYCEDFLYCPDNGDYDTKGIFYMIKPNGEKEDLNIFVHYSKDGETIYLTKEQYESMKKEVK